MTARERSSPAGVRSPAGTGRDTELSASFRILHHPIGVSVAITRRTRRSPRGVQLLDTRQFREHLLGRRKAIDPNPFRARRAPDQHRRGVIHLVAAIDVECALRTLTGSKGSGVVLP